MVSRVKTPLLIEAEERLGRMPRGGMALVAQLTGLSVGRVRQMAKGMEPTGSTRIGPAGQQVQLVVYELRKLQDRVAQATDGLREDGHAVADCETREQQCLSRPKGG